MTTENESVKSDLRVTISGLALFTFRTKFNRNNEIESHSIHMNNQHTINFNDKYYNIEQNNHISKTELDDEILNKTGEIKIKEWFSHL